MRFDNLNSGDFIAVYQAGTLVKRFATRVMATMFVLNDGRKFSRRSGRQRGSSSWSSVFAEPWTDEHDIALAERRKEKEMRDLRDRLRAIDWRVQDETRIRQAVSALELAGVLEKQDASRPTEEPK